MVPREPDVDAGDAGGENRGAQGAQGGEKQVISLVIDDDEGECHAPRIDDDEGHRNATDSRTARVNNN